MDLPAFANKFPYKLIDALPRMQSLHPLHSRYALRFAKLLEW